MYTVPVYMQPAVLCVQCKASALLASPNVETCLGQHVQMIDMNHVRDTGEGREQCWLVYVSVQRTRRTEGTPKARTNAHGLKHTVQDRVY